MITGKTWTRLRQSSRQKEQQTRGNKGKLTQSTRQENQGSRKRSKRVGLNRPGHPKVKPKNRPEHSTRSSKDSRKRETRHAAAQQPERHRQNTEKADKTRSKASDH